MNDIDQHLADTELVAETWKREIPIVIAREGRLPPDLRSQLRQGIAMYADGRDHLAASPDPRHVRMVAIYNELIELFNEWLALPDPN